VVLAISYSTFTTAFTAFTAFSACCRTARCCGGLFRVCICCPALHTFVQTFCERTFCFQFACCILTRPRDWGKAEKVGLPAHCEKYYSR
jgi:hypothetical protein